MSIVEYSSLEEHSFTGEEEVDEEDVRERNQLELDRIVDLFVDEPRIYHNVYPETDEEDEVEQTKPKKLDMRRGDGNLYEGQLFSSGLAFKDAVLDHALKSNRNIKQFRCDSNKWEIINIVEKHNCYGNGQCEMLKVHVLTSLFLDKIRAEPEYFMSMKIQQLVYEKWSFRVSRPQCQASRNRALISIEKEYDKQFERIRDCGAELLVSNPNSSVAIETLTNAAGLDVFNRFYICFDSLRKSWKENCRPLLGVDNCFLRSTTKGQLLVALGRDANNAIYLVAWSVIQVENTNNWIWFVKKIKEDLSLGDGDGFILVSDRYKGLIAAVELELPKIEHKMCVRHIYANLKTKHGKKDADEAFIWNLAWSYDEVEFRDNLKRLQEYDKYVFTDVMRMNPQFWCRAFYKIRNHCEDVKNNSTESFNSSIVKAREKPFVPMLVHKH